MNKKLRLQRETLRRLNGKHLATVQGGVTHPCGEETGESCMQCTGADGTCGPATGVGTGPINTGTQVDC